MNKDIIYIDVEDDITAIIGKIKASNEKIIAIVPPKHTGILQSAVNLRLLNRMANTSHKRLVIITNNQALVALSASAGIPVAKNLQSKPELAELTAIDVDEGDDIIDGSMLSVGQHVDLSKRSAKEEALSDNEIESIDIDDSTLDVSASKDVKSKSDTAKKSSGIKVPNFGKFRKKFFLIAAAGVLFIVFLIWANVFAPAARVIITAKTSPASVSSTVTLVGNAQTDVAKGIIQSVSQELKKDNFVDFTATGQKDLGNKASGTMTIQRTSYSSLPLTVPSGTSFTNGDLVYFSTQSATLEGTQVGPGGLIQDSATVNVSAAGPGEKYNISARSYSSDVAGISSEGSVMVGGTSRIAAIVTATDIQTATTKFKAQTDASVKKELMAKFATGEIVIEDSLTVVNADPVSTPAVDAESTDGKARLTATTTYIMTALPKADVEAFLKENINKQLAGTANQKIYSDGIDTVKLQNYSKTDASITVKIISTGQIGPSINESDIKEQVKGKIYGEVQSTLVAIPGIDSVDVKFSYFWVTKVPSDINKISVEFNIQHE